MTENKEKEALRKKRRADKILQHAIGMADKEAQEVGSVTFSPRCTLLATLPHRDPGNIPFFTRRNGDYTLIIQPGTTLALDQKTGIMLGYPYGSIPRLILAWLTTEAVRTKSKTIYLGDSLSDFLQKLDLGNHGGIRGDITRLRNHLERLFGATISIHYAGERRKKSERLSILHQTIYWWDPNQVMTKEEPQRAAIVLAEEFYREIVDCPVPLDLRIIHALKQSSLALDIYSWLTYRMSYLKRKTIIPWASLALQFGSDYTRLRAFKEHFLEQLRAVKMLYSHARFSTESDYGLTLYPSRPQVLKKDHSKI